MVGRLVSFWDRLFSGAMLVSGRVLHGKCFCWMESVKVWFALPTDAAYALQHASEPCLAEEAIFTKATWIFLGETAMGISWRRGMVHCGLLHWFQSYKKQITRGSIGLSPFPSNSHHQDYYMFSSGFLYTFICNYCVEGGQPNGSSMFDSTEQSTIFCLFSWYPKVALDPLGMMKNFHIFIAVDLNKPHVFLKIKLLRSTLAPGKKSGWSLVEVLFSQTNISFGCCLIFLQS